MMKLLSLVAFISLCSPALGIGGAIQGLEDAMEIQRQQMERLHDFLGPTSDSGGLPKRQPDSPTISFSNT